MMNSNEYFNLVNEDGLYRLNRIASVFCTKNDGPLEYPIGIRLILSMMIQLIWVALNF